MSRNDLSRLIPGVLVPLCLSACWWAFKIARADSLALQDTPASLRQAIALVPDQARYYLRLAQLGPEEEVDSLLEKAVILNPYEASARIELALREESKRNLGRAEQLLLEAASVDHTWLPRWSLVNFYFRHDRADEFWRWARSAAEMPVADLTPLFRLCLRVAPDTVRLARDVVPNDADPLKQLIRFLMSEDQLAAVPAPAFRLIECGTPDHRGLILSVIDRFREHGDALSAIALWQRLQYKGWIPPDSGQPYNGDFAHPFLQAGFDWHSNDFDGILRTRSTAGLEIEFFGKEPKSCILLEQHIWAPGGIVSVQSRYKTAGVNPGSGLRWQIVNTDGHVLATSPDLARDDVIEQSWILANPLPMGLVSLRLDYQRASGTTRIVGTLLLERVRLRQK